MSSLRSSKDKIKSPQELKRALSKKRDIVFTNGCFDILHKGHVSYLERAKKLGKTLVVALNDDASVKRQGKGDDRPINPLEDRLEVMAALQSVDYVTWFTKDTPLELIELLRPHVLVKGGDWKVSQIVGGKEVIARGGKVKSLAFIKGKSTTQILKKIRGR